MTSGRPTHVSRLWFFGLAAICFLALVRAHYQLGVTVGESMLPTLRSGDLLIIHRTAYRRSEPERGDIVVARYQGKPIVKRVIALPGEDVEVRLGRVYVNDLPLAENSPIIAGDLDISRGKLFSGKVALLGDNRLVSIHAVISKDQIVGRVAYRIPLNWAFGRNRVDLHSSAHGRAALNPSRPL